MGKENKTVRFEVKRKESDVYLLGGKEAVYEQMHEDFDKRITEAKYKSRKKVKG